MSEQPDSDGLPALPPASEYQGVPGHDAAALRDREREALRKRRLGMTYDQIATDMGFASSSGARQLIMRALDRTVGASAAQLRALENERLDTQVQVLTTIMLDRERTATQRIHAADALTRVSARRSRLNGLDAPVQIAVGAGSLSELDDALALLTQTVTGEVTDSHVITDADTTVDGGAGDPGPGTPPGSSSDH